MKAVLQESIGKPAEVLHLVEQPSRAPGAGEAQVRILASPIHPSNLLQIGGLYGVQPKLPSTPGAEAVGEVIAVGEGVRHLQVGQRVAFVTSEGTWRDELTTTASVFIPLPPGGDIEQLCMLTINPMTAYLMLHSLVQLQPGDWVVQSGANSAVGEYLIQLAKLAGFHTVNVVRRESLIPQLTALGADAVLVDGPELAQRIRAATGGAPVRLAIDCVGGDTMTALIGALGYGGTAVSYGGMSGQPGALDPGTLIFRELTLRGFWLSKWFELASMEDKQAAFGTLVPLVAGGQLVATIDSRFSLEQITEAVTRAGSPGRDGKVLLIPRH